MIGSPRSCRGGRNVLSPVLALAAVLVFAEAGPAAAQTTVRTTVEENLRREPQGQILGRLAAGTPLARVAAQGSWVQVTMEGWVWTASLQSTDREGFTLVVSASDGENLRAEPSGQILGRLEAGTLLEEVERRPGWARVRRTGWIWSASVSQPASTPTQRATGTGAGTPAAAARTTGVGTPTPPTVPAGERFVRLPGGAPILSVPDGDTLGRASGAGDLEVLAREGSWLRVRLDGWVWRPATADAAADPGGDSEEIVPSDLSGPGGAAFEGRRVTWRVQFISLERAESVRTDFFEGEPFILGRVGGAEGPFVYVAVPPDRLPQVRGFAPLEVVTVTGRIRKASSALTLTPILDLLAVERGPGR